VAFVRFDYQLKHGDLAKSDGVVLYFPHGVGSAEVPLLTHDLPEGMLNALRPSQEELLSARFDIFKSQRDTSQGLAFVEVHPYYLRAGTGRTPTSIVFA
jgi:hypothetical protein